MFWLVTSAVLSFLHFCSGDMCSAVQYIFGEPLPSTEKAVFFHKVGFSRNPLELRNFEFGSDCACENLACYRRQSEYCIEAATSDDPLTQTWKSYEQMNPYTKYIGVVFLMDLPAESFQRLGLLVRTCYPYLTVFCMFRGEASLFPWMRDCCDAIVISSNKIHLNESQVLFSHESADERDETTIFTMTEMKLNCNKCGIATSLQQPNFDEPHTYKEQQGRTAGQNLSIVVRSRDAYLTLVDTDEPFKIKITGGFEPFMVRDIATAMNFSYYYIGNLSTLTTGGGINSNGTFDGMLDMLLKRTAVVSLSNQKPIHPGDELFTFSNCYDVDTLPFATRIEFFPVTIHMLFDSLGEKILWLLAASIVSFSLVSYGLLSRIRRCRLGTLGTLIWFYTFRLVNTGFTLALVMNPKVPAQINGLRTLWAIKALIIASLFSGVWVTFIATPPLKGVINTFADMMTFIVKKNSTCYMSSGLVAAGYVYGTSAKPIFDRAVGTSNAKMIISQLRDAKRRPFWFYERMFIVYQLNRYDKQGTIHISSDSFIMQPQCWIIQKNCVFRRSLSTHLNYYLESGLLSYLKKWNNVSTLPPRQVVNSFDSLTVEQLEEILVFVTVAPLLVIVVLVCEVCHKQLVNRRVTPAPDLDKVDTKCCYEYSRSWTFRGKSESNSSVYESYPKVRKHGKGFGHFDFDFSHQ